MKGHLKMSLSLVALLLVALLSMTACTGELEDKVAGIETTVADVQTAIDALEAADAALQTAIDANASAADLTAKVDELNAAIDAAEAAAAAAAEAVAGDVEDLEEKLAADLAGLKTELEGKITAAIASAAAASESALNAAKAELKTAIDAKADTAAMNTAVENLNAAITAAKNSLQTAIDAKAASADLNAAITSLTAKIADAANAAINAKDYGDLNDEVTAAYRELEASFVAWNAVSYLYTDADKAAVEKAYVAAMIDILRALTEKDIDDAQDAFDAVVAKADENTVPAQLYALLVKINDGSKVLVDDNDVVILTAVTLADAADVAAAAQIVTDAQADGRIYAAIQAYGTEGYDLAYISYVYSQQITVLTVAQGADAVKAKINALANVITLGDEAAVKAARDAYDAWVAANDPADVDVNGLATAPAKLTDAEARIAELKLAKDAAEVINNRINAVIVKANEATKNELDAIAAAIADWAATYHIVLPANIPADASDDDKADYNTNYNMVNNAKLAELNAEFDALTAAIKESGKDVIDAVNAIGTVNILSGDAIKKAANAYYQWTYKYGAEDFDFLFGEEGLDTYFETLSTKQGEFATLSAQAESAWIAAAAGVDGITVDNITLYNTTVAEALAWFDTYAVENQDGSINWGTAGYVFSTVTVAKADYDNLKALEKALDDMIAAKATEAAALNAAIAEKLEGKQVTTAFKADIEALEAAYVAYLAAGENNEVIVDGSKDTENTAMNIVVDTALLTAARATYNALLADIADIQDMLDDILEAAETVVSPAYFADAAARNAFADMIADAKYAIDTFYVKNGELPLENNFDADELKAYYAANLLVAKDAAMEKIFNAQQTALTLAITNGNMVAVAEINAHYNDNLVAWIAAVAYTNELDGDATYANVCAAIVAAEAECARIATLANSEFAEMLEMDVEDFEYEVLVTTYVSAAPANLLANMNGDWAVDFIRSGAYELTFTPAFAGADYGVLNFVDNLAGLNGLSGVYNYAYNAETGAIDVTDANGAVVVDIMLTYDLGGNISLQTPNLRMPQALYAVGGSNGSATGVDLDVVAGKDSTGAYVLPMFLAGESLYIDYTGTEVAAYYTADADCTFTLEFTSTDFFFAYEVADDYAAYPSNMVWGSDGVSLFNFNMTAGQSLTIVFMTESYAPGTIEFNYSIN